jgi:hypothetical protein
MGRTGLLSPVGGRTLSLSRPVFPVCAISASRPLRGRSPRKMFTQWTIRDVSRDWKFAHGGGEASRSWPALRALALFSIAGISAQPDALFAAGLSACAVFLMLLLDSLPIFTVIVIVMYLPMFRRLFDRVRVIRSNLRHSRSPFSRDPGIQFQCRAERYSRSGDLSMACPVSHPLPQFPPQFGNSRGEIP